MEKKITALNGLDNKMRGGVWLVFFSAGVMPGPPSALAAALSDTTAGPWGDPAMSRGGKKQ